MTPEERLTDIETKLQFTANMLQQMGLRHAGIRGLYRQGVNRMEELLDQQERQSMLLTALMESQMRTESQMRRTDEQMRRTDEQIRRTDEQMQSLAKTFESYLASRQTDRPGA